MISFGNTKLGPGVHSWSLPAILSCPGRSGLCEGLCYGRRGRYLMRSVRAAETRNLEVSRQRNFSLLMSSALHLAGTQVLRKHANGDYYDAPYVRKWMTIIRRRPQITYYAYTRSWRDPEIMPALLELASLEPMRLWLSSDRETGEPPREHGLQVCYLSTGDDDLPAWPVDLVFRNRPKTSMRFTPDGDLVCPYEQHLETGSKPTCTICKICWRDAPVPSKRGVTTDAQIQAG